MASYWDMGITPVPFTADVDLTAKQWMLVAPASTPGSVKVVDSACNPLPVGILVNDPSAGQAAAVVIFGPVKAKCRVNGTCSLKNGRLLVAASDGFLEPMLTAGSAVFARYFDALQTTAAASFIGQVFIMGYSGSGNSLGTS
jgi:hypothetical protein